jgi:phenylalanyl-tRNA synthetase alpha chain
LKRSLAIKDLTDSTNGKHAINIMLEEIQNKIESHYNLKSRLIRKNPIVSKSENYDRLYYPEDTVTKSSRYTRWVDKDHLLRTHTSSMIPEILTKIDQDDILLICPGLVYRRDEVNKTHIGEPHQVDIWRITKSKIHNRESLLNLVEIVVNVILPNCEWRYNETSHYYTKDGIEVEVLINGEWIEILECGEVLPKLLDDSNLDSSIYSGLAMGIGLDRAVMLKKGIKDIRILRSENERISKQMMDLNPYKEVSLLPAIIRDLSVAVEKDLDKELLGDIIRNIMGEDQKTIEEIKIKSETNYYDLPLHVRERLGMKENMKNILLRIVLRSLDKNLTNEEANEIYTKLYKEIHLGSVGYEI